MKKILALILLSVSALTLAACGNSAKTAPETVQETAAAAGETENAADSETAESIGSDTADNASATGEMRLFQTENGEIEIPVNPQKIVSDYLLGEFLALDVKPIIASPYSLSNPFLERKTDGIQELNITSSETALEMITEVEPDLIVTITEADYENYSKIAPTVYIPSDKYSPEELFYYIADMLGKTTEAEAYMNEFTDRAQAAKDEISGIVGERSVSFIEVWPNEIYVLGNNFARGGSILFDIWGLKAPEVVQNELINTDKQYDTVSLEAMPDYAGDIIFYSTLAGTDNSFVEDSEVWNNLPAVKNGLVKEYEQVAFMHSDPITLNGQLDYYLEYFRTLEGE